MIECNELFRVFKDQDIDFFSGVPDSTFKDWMKFLVDEPQVTNIIAVNECEATAICAGYYLARAKIGVAYMQNSGLGKAVNPITSLIDPEVYSIPVLFMLGWRGEPGQKDEPQHVKMGKVMLPLLETLNIPYTVLSNNIHKAEQEIKQAKEYMVKKMAPYAIIIKKGLLKEYQQQKKAVQDYEMKREQAISTIVDVLNGDEVIVATTGKTSRELFEYRETTGKEHKNDFYTVGSMGCASGIALAIALEKKDKSIFIFDGDGAVLMQMGSLATIGHYQPENLIHILFDNEAHESTGGQPTVSQSVDFEKAARACGYREIWSVSRKKELEEIISTVKDKKGPVFICIKVRKGSRPDLGRPTLTPIQNKQALMDFLLVE